MTELPAGTVTFLFSDIEGSTQLLQQIGPDHYEELLSDQRRIMREAFVNWHGQEVDTQGDSFFVSFSRATEAVSAAEEIQRSLAAHPWPEDVGVPLRLHDEGIASTFHVHRCPTTIGHVTFPLGLWPRPADDKVLRIPRVAVQVH